MLPNALDAVTQWQIFTVLKVRNDNHQELIMERRKFLGALGAAGAAGAMVNMGSLAQTPSAYSYDRPVFHNGELKAPARGRIRVAFMISEGANVIDLAGPWEVFQDVHVGRRMPFQLYTVGPSEKPITATGGLKIIPNYSVDNAPEPHLVTVGAQRGSPETTRWLQSVSKKTDVTMSICTGGVSTGTGGLAGWLPGNHAPRLL